MVNIEKKKKELKEIQSIYIFLSLLLKDKLSLNEYLIQGKNYLIKSEEEFKILSISVNDNKLNYKLNNNKIIFFDELDNAKIYDINIFLNLLKKIEKELKDIAVYNELNFRSLINEFNVLMNNVMIKSFKIVLLKDEKVYNKKFEILNSNLLLNKGVEVYNKKVFLILNENIDLKLNGIYKEKIKINQFKNKSISTNDDIMSLMALYNIKYNIDNIYDFYNKVCILNPNDVVKSSIKKYYKKEIEDLVFDFVNNLNLTNYLYIKYPYQIKGIISDNKIPFSDLKKYKISIDLGKLKENHISLNLNINYYSNINNYKFIQECIETNKELKTLLVKGLSFENSLKYQTYINN